MHLYNQLITKEATITGTSPKLLWVRSCSLYVNIKLFTLSSSPRVFGLFYKIFDTLVNNINT